MKPKLNAAQTTAIKLAKIEARSKARQAKIEKSKQVKISKQNEKPLKSIFKEAGRTAREITGQISARKIIEAQSKGSARNLTGEYNAENPGLKDSLDKYISIITANPDASSGSSGKSQDGSTTDIDSSSSVTGKLK